MILTGETVSIIIFLIGLYGVIFETDVVKTILSMFVMQVATVLLFISVGNKGSYQPPIEPIVEVASDPLPQALMITDIVVGIATTAVALSLMIRFYNNFNTANWRKIIEYREGFDD
jgi:multicomponent Na+:H+ antiporter subunit C